MPIPPTFYEQLIRQFPFAKNVQTQKVSPIVDFINILRTNFLYELCFGSFALVTCRQKKLPKRSSYKKFVCKMLMKLTPRSYKKTLQILAKIKTTYPQSLCPKSLRAQENREIRFCLRYREVFPVDLAPGVSASRLGSQSSNSTKRKVKSEDSGIVLDNVLFAFQVWQFPNLK